MPPYLNADDVNAKLSQLESASSTLCTLEILQHPSKAGRTIKMARITKGSRDGKTAVLIEAGIHGNELAPPDGILSFLEKLVAAYDGNQDFTAGNYTLPANKVKGILDKLVIYVIPLVNPDGREIALAGGGSASMVGRKNGPPATAVDLNRNFDILWDYTVHFAATAGVFSSKTVTAQDFIGTAKESEPETRNVKKVLEDKGIKFFFDLHAFVPAIYHPWGIDTNQGTDNSQSFNNPAKDGQRDGVKNPGYQEFIPDPVRDEHVALAEDMRKAVEDTGTGANYPPAKQSAELYVTSGCSDDYAFSRNLEQRRCFTVEFGSSSQGGFRPDRTTQYPNIEKEIHAAMAAALNHIAGAAPAPPVGPAPPIGPAPPSSPGTPFFGLFNLRLSLSRFLTRIVLRLPPIVFPSPTPGSAPPGGPIHSLRLSTNIASAGQTVRGTLLDQSLDFTQINRALFYVFLQVPPRAGSMGNVFFRVRVVRFFGPRELEFEVPPVGNGNPSMMVPPGAYIVLCRYSFWTVDGDRLLTVR